eukprot:3688956-Rhodomonas_salina.2
MSLNGRTLAALEDALPDLPCQHTVGQYRTRRRESVGCWTTCGRERVGCKDTRSAYARSVPDIA